MVSKIHTLAHNEKLIKTVNGKKRKMYCGILPAESNLKALLYAEFLMCSSKHCTFYVITCLEYATFHEIICWREIYCNAQNYSLTFLKTIFWGLLTWKVYRITFLKDSGKLGRHV